MAETTISAQEHASLEHVLAELAMKEQVCKDLEKCQMTLRDQVQQLQLENKACKFGLKRENQWQLEREKLIFDLDSANLAAVEKDERIQQLERDLSGARGAIECVQTKCKEIERSKDKEINQKERLQAELEDARIAIENLERDCKLKEEMLTKQRQAESDLFRKLETQKKLLQSHLSEAKRKAEEFDEMEMNFQIAVQKLNDKDKQLNYLRDAHEKLCIANTGRQMQGHQEKETIINALEASQEKCEEQEEKLRKLEHDLGRAKNQMKQLEIRCKAAEAEVNTKSTSLIKVHMELETLAVSVAELAETKKQTEELVLKLKATENSLKQEMAARDLAELALKEYKKREEHLLMIEEGHSELQGKSKWRNEQFQSLEEAHSIIRTEFQESQRIWESERDSMVGEIDTLRENLQSKGKLIHDLHCRLDMLQQALAHEQSHRKVLELELVEARTGMGEAAADLERMHSAIENLKQETAEEIVLLKNNVLVKDRQIREMEIRQKEIEQENEELQSMQLEFENFKRLNGELQQALGLKDKQFLLLEEARNNDVGVAQARGLEWEEEKNLLIQSLTEAEASLSSKEARLKELSNELDAVRSSLECLRAAKLDFEQKHSEEKDNLLLILHQANETVAAKEELVKELKTELTRLQVLIDHTQIAQVEAECQAKILEQHLTEAHGEVKTTTKALELLTESGKAEKASLVEIIDGQNERIHEMKAAHDAQLVQTLEDLKNQDDQLMHIQTQYQDLQQLMNHREAKQRELEKVHEQQLWQLHSEERQWQEEKEKLIMELQHFEVQGIDQEKQLREQTAALERNKDVILKLEAHCHSLEQQVAEQTLLGELANGKMSIERAECMKLKKEVQQLNESFTAAIIAKDASLEQLRENITELQVGYQEHTNQTLRITTLEKRLEEDCKMRANMEKHMLVLNAELDQSVLEVERLSAENGSLQASIRSLQDDSNVTKGVLESQLQTLEERLSVSNAELQTQLEIMGIERDLVLKQLSAKEAESHEICKENKALNAEKSNVDSLARVLEEEKLDLLREVESNRLAIQTLTLSLELAEENLALTRGELKDFQSKLGCADAMLLRLQIAEEKAQKMEEKLHESRAAVEDKEERLAASEWAVQQLAREIAKAKSSLAQKEREEAFLQDRLTDLERHLQDKEREMIEMEVYLDSVVKASEAKQADIDKLTLKMQDMKKGADEWKKREIDLETELHGLKITLEEKSVSLLESEAEVKRASEEHQVMKGEIKDLKQHLSEEVKVNSVQQCKMDELICDLESAKQAVELANVQLKELQGKLQQLDQGSKDRLQRSEIASDELQHKLMSTESRLHTSGKKMEEAAVDLAAYEEKYACLLQVISEKDKLFDEVQGKLSSAQLKLAEQAMLVQQANRDLISAQEQLQTQVEMQRGLERSVGETEAQMVEMQQCKWQLEQEVRRLKKAVEVARQESTSRNSEIERYRSQIEQLEEISSQFGDAQTLISSLTGELQITSSTVEERDRSLLKLQSSLKTSQDQLRESRELIMARENEREILAVKLTVAESRVEEMETQMLSMQEALGIAESGLREETEKVLHHVAALKEAQLELVEWKEKAATATKEARSVKDELDITLKGLQTELLGWKGKAEEGKVEKLGFETRIMEMQAEVEGWRERAGVAATEGQAMRDHLEFSIKLQQGELEQWKQTASAAEEREKAAKNELEGSVRALQNELSGLKGSIDSAEEERAAKLELEKLLKVMQADLEGWKEEAACAAKLGSSIKEEMEKSIEDLQAELEQWKMRALTAETQERKLRSEFELMIKDLQIKAEAWQKVAANGAEEARSAKLEMENSLKLLQVELLEWKQKSACAIDEQRCVKMTLEASIVELQAELEGWRKSAAVSAKETESIKAAYDASLKDIEIELAAWKQKAGIASEKVISTKTEFEILMQELHSEVALWKERAESASEEWDTERAHIQNINMNTMSEMEQWKEQAVAVAEQTKCLKLELDNAMNVIADLTAQLELQEEKELTMEKKTQQLEGDLARAEEEALSRRLKMLHILAQLESTHASQKELKAQLEMQHRQLTNEADGFSVHYPDGEGLKRDIRKANPQMEKTSGLVLANKQLEDEAWLVRMQAEELKSEACRLAADLEVALADLSTKNLAVNQLNVELSGLRSLVSMLESKREITSEEMSSTTSADDNSNKTVNGQEKVISMKEVGRDPEFHNSILRQNEGLEKHIELQASMQSQIHKPGSQSPKRFILSPKVDHASPHRTPSSNRKRIVESPRPVSITRVSADASISKVLGEVDENSPVPSSAERVVVPVHGRRCQLSHSPVQYSKRSRNVSTDVKNSDSNSHADVLF